MADVPAKPARKNRGPYNYLVCRLEGGKLIPLNHEGEDASSKWPPVYVTAKTPREARAKVFEKMTERQPTEKRDAYHVDLVAVRDDAAHYQRMAWNVTREVAR